MANPDAIRNIFSWSMGFAGLVVVWTVGLMIFWPTQQTSVWQPDFRLIATCADKKPCSIQYGQLKDSQFASSIVSLSPPEPAGDFGEPDAWLKWRTGNGTDWTYQVTRSSWHFETTVRYRIDKGTPVLVEVRHIDGKPLQFGIGLAILSLAGIYLRGRMSRP